MSNVLIDAFLNAVFPPRCAICNEVIAPAGYFCSECEGLVKTVRDKRCTGCGLPLKRCECNSFIYHFDGIVSPFYNSGNSKKAYYSYKFGKNKRLSDYFAKEMALCTKRSYKNIKFDFLTCVCSSDSRSEYKHCEILAKRLAKLLKLKFVKTLKPCKKREVQHTLRFDRRFENVHNAYIVKDSLKGKRILLVDDIKTSGATIDECARQLRLAGAKYVYCVTALIGSDKSED